MNINFLQKLILMRFYKHVSAYDRIELLFAKGFIPVNN